MKAILHEKDIFEIVKDVVEKEKILDRVVINELLEHVGKRTKSKIEYEIVNFLNENRNHLPFYHIPYLQQPEESTQQSNNDDKEEEKINVENDEKQDEEQKDESKGEIKDEQNEEPKDEQIEEPKENSIHSSVHSKKS